MSMIRDLRAVVEQTLYFNQHHRGKMFPHLRAITFSDLFHSRPIPVLIGYINGESRDRFRTAARFARHGNNVGERAIELLDKVVTDNVLLFVPGNLAGDEKQSTARFS